uniref:Uncharacterized protein n=1 Tax=Arundo donax TaxID=35708 RepID=A0A0A9AKR0_ARUDO
MVSLLTGGLGQRWGPYRVGIDIQTLQSYFIYSSSQVCGHGQPKNFHSDYILGGCVWIVDVECFLYRLRAVRSWEI